MPGAVREEIGERRRGADTAVRPAARRHPFRDHRAAGPRERAHGRDFRIGHRNGIGEKKHSIAALRDRAIRKFVVGNVVVGIAEIAQQKPHLLLQQIVFLAAVLDERRPQRSLRIEYRHFVLGYKIVDEVHSGAFHKTAHVRQGVSKSARERPVLVDLRSRLESHQPAHSVERRAPDIRHRRRAAPRIPPVPGHETSAGAERAVDVKLSAAAVAERGIHHVELFPPVRAAVCRGSLRSRKRKTHGRIDFLDAVYGKRHRIRKPRVHKLEMIGPACDVLSARRPYFLARKRHDFVPGRKIRLPGVIELLQRSVAHLHEFAHLLETVFGETEVHRVAAIAGDRLLVAEPDEAHAVTRQFLDKTVQRLRAFGEKLRRRKARRTRQLHLVSRLRVGVRLRRTVQPGVSQKRRMDIVAHREVLLHTHRIGDNRGNTDSTVDFRKSGPKIFAVVGARPGSDFEIGPCVFPLVRTDAQFNAAASEHLAVGADQPRVHRVGPRRERVFDAERPLHSRTGIRESLGHGASVGIHK